jgi:hypothetical protein
MAYTYTKNAQFSNGNLIQQLWKVTADAAAGELKTGLNTIAGVSVTLASSTTALEGKISVTGGSVTFSGGNSSGTEFYVSVYGR